MKNTATACWNGLREGDLPDWSLYDGLELAGVSDFEGECERIEPEDGMPSFISLYGHLKEGGCQCLHDFNHFDIDAIRQEALSLIELHHELQVHGLNDQTGDYIDATKGDGGEGE